MSIKAVGLGDPVLQFEDGDGVPYAAGSVAFYAVGTSNLLDVYSDTGLTVALPNPVPLNAAGRSSTSITGTDTGVYFQQASYDYSLFDADDVLVYGPISFSGSLWPGQVQGQATLSPSANANAYTNRFTTTINKAPSGTHALFAGTRFDIPTIGAGASTLTESATVYIEGAPATGTNPYALHVAAGTAKFSGPATFTSTVNLSSATVTGAGIPRVLSQSTTEQEVVSTVTETSVFSYAVPANTLGTTSRLEFEMECTYLNNSGGADTFTPRIKFGGTTIASSAPSIGAGANRRTMKFWTVINANGATNSQRAASGWTYGASAAENTFDVSATAVTTAYNGSLALDSTGALTFTATVQHGTSAATISLKRFSGKLTLFTAP